MNSKTFLCKEDAEEFFMTAESLEVAKKLAAIYNAIVIKEIDVEKKNEA